jgi:hypothetical protein
MQKYSQTCIKRSPLEQRKSDLLRQVTSSLKKLNSYEIFYDRTGKRWSFNTGDCSIEVTTWLYFSFTMIWNIFTTKAVFCVIYLLKSLLITSIYSQGRLNSIIGSRAKQCRGIKMEMSIKLNMHVYLLYWYFLQIQCLNIKNMPYINID